MPLYTYICSCGYSFDEITASDVNTVICPECEKQANRSFPIPQSPKIGLTQADGRIRDKMKRNAKTPTAMFDDGKGHRF